MRVGSVFYRSTAANPVTRLAQWIGQGLPDDSISLRPTDEQSSSSSSPPSYYPWDPLNQFSSAPQISISLQWYATIATRIAVLEARIGVLTADRRCSYQTRQRIRQLRYVQDAALIEALRMETCQVFVPQQQDDDDTAAAISPMCLANLPNLTFMMIYLKFWSAQWSSDLNNFPFPGHPHLLPLLHFFGKFLPHACVRRGIVEGIEKKLQSKEIPMLKRLLIACIAHSLLGGYPWCITPANFHARKHVYSFFLRTEMTDAHFVHWCKDNSLFVLFSVREYLFYMITQMPALHGALERLYYWSSIVNITVTALDHVRGILNQRALRLAHGYCPARGWGVDPHAFQQQHPRAVLKCLIYDADPLLHAETELAHFLGASTAESLLWQPTEALLSKCEDVFRQANKHILDLSPRPNKDCLTFYVTKAMRTLVQRRAIDKITGNAQGMYAFAGLELPDDLISQVRYVLRESWQRVRAGTATSWGYEWMIHVYGLTLASCCLFRAATGFFLNDSEKSEVQNALTEIFETNQRDFFLLLALMEAIVYERALMLYPLPAAVIFQQRHRFARTVDQKRVNTTVLWCPNCSEFKHGYADPATPCLSRKERELSRTDIGVIHSLDLEDSERPIEVSCLPEKKRRSSSSSSNDIATILAGEEPAPPPAEMISVDDDDDDMPPKKKKKKKNNNHQLKAIFVKRCYEQCTDTACIPIDMVGKMVCVTHYVTLQRRLFFLCPYCGALTIFRYQSFQNTAPANLNCGCLAKDPAHTQRAPSRKRRREEKKKKQQQRAGKKELIVAPPQQQQQQRCVLCRELRRSVQWILFWNDVKDAQFHVPAEHYLHGASCVCIAPICQKKPCCTIDFLRSEAYFWRFSEILVITRYRAASKIVRIGEGLVLRVWRYPPRTGIRAASGTVFDRVWGAQINQFVQNHAGWIGIFGSR